MKKNRLLIITSIICTIAVIVMIIALIVTDKTEVSVAFTPPPFDAAAQKGMPEVADESWTRIYQSGMSFSAYICGNIQISDGKADIYFTNTAGNNVWLKLRITDEAGNILGETGIIKPDEYIKSIAFNKIPSNGASINMKIMSYEPETYYSTGAVSLNTVALVLK